MKVFSFYFLLFLAIWLTLNLIQGSLTQLAEDEAYYWMYSRRLAWGYFDHPPMIAVFVAMGSSLFNGELEVRIMTIVAQIFSLLLIWKIIDERRPDFRRITLFFAIAFSIPVFQLYGFIATPDSPLLFFTACFLLGYKKFLASDSLKNSLFLAIAMAGLMYSKYHGGLLILFTILSNLKLLRKRNFWLAAFVSVLLFTPHIAWQLNKDFPTLGYQVTGRFKYFKFKDFLEYLPNQLAVFNPLTFGLLIVILKAKNTERNTFEKTLKFITAGFILFFWMASFWIRPEPHWTAIATIPAIILIYNWIFAKGHWNRFITFSMAIIICLLLLLRIHLVYEIFPYKMEFHDQKEWANNVSKIAGDAPVAFINSYQKASIYSFYTGMEGFSVNNIFHRRNQFDLWDDEIRYHGKMVAHYVESNNLTSNDSVSGQIGNDVIVHKTFFNVQRIRILFDAKWLENLNKDGEFSIPIEIINPNPYPVYFNLPNDKVSFRAVFVQRKVKWIADAIPETEIAVLNPGETAQNHLRFKVPVPEPGQYQFAFCLRTPILPETFNSTFVKIEIR